MSIHGQLFEIAHKGLAWRPTVAAINVVGNDERNQQISSVRGSCGVGTARSNIRRSAETARAVSRIQEILDRTNYVLALALCSIRLAVNLQLGTRPAWRHTENDR
jgi:hypothetical protein